VYEVNIDLSGFIDSLYLIELSKQAIKRNFREASSRGAFVVEQINKKPALETIVFGIGRLLAQVFLYTEGTRSTSCLIGATIDQRMS
jgi:hypothetical protein